MRPPPPHGWWQAPLALAGGEGEGGEVGVMPASWPSP